MATEYATTERRFPLSELVAAFDDVHATNRNAASRATVSVGVIAELSDWVHDLQ